MLFRSAGANGQALAQGEEAFVLSQPEFSQRREFAAGNIEMLDQQLAGLGGIAGGEERRPSMMQLQALRQAEEQAAQQDAERLHLVAPAKGLLLDVDPDIGVGTWVGQRQSLGVIVEPDRWLAEVYVLASARDRFRPGAAARFYPQGDAGSPIPGTVRDIDTARLSQLPHPLLATVHGGHVPVLPDHTGTAQKLVPRDVLYRVRIELQGRPDWLAVRRGVAVIDAEPRSWLWDALNAVLLVVVREATF